MEGREQGAKTRKDLCSQRVSSNKGTLDDSLTNIDEENKDLASYFSIGISKSPTKSSSQKQTSRGDKPEDPMTTEKKNITNIQIPEKHINTNTLVTKNICTPDTPESQQLAEKVHQKSNDKTFKRSGLTEGVTKGAQFTECMHL